MRATRAGRIDREAVVRLARSDLPRPLDVLNLIHMRDERSYARYGLAVTPVMLGVGARLLWMGRHHRTLAGEPQAERLMVVRYPSHRRFLAMTLNPYYLLINRWRERGVRGFEAAFTHPYWDTGALTSQPCLLVAHFNQAMTLDRVRAGLEPSSGPLVYASRQVASAHFLRGNRPSDPNPLTYKEIACFAAAEDLVLDGPSLNGVALSVYRRSHPRTLLPQAR